MSKEFFLNEVFCKKYGIIYICRLDGLIKISVVINLDVMVCLKLNYGKLYLFVL